MNFKPAFSYEWLLFKNNYFKNDCMFTDKAIKAISTAIQDVIEIELTARESIENYLRINDINYSQDNFINKLPYECGVCPSLNYMSYLECKACMKKYCISHFYICKCPSKSVTLFYRFNSDLKYYSRGKFQ